MKEFGHLFVFFAGRLLMERNQKRRERKKRKRSRKFDHKR
jgi:hypothetical protein